MATALQYIQTSRTPLPIDEEIGNRIRTRRIAIGVSQTGLAEQIRVSFQQIQKYESGRNRISIGRMLEISAALNTSVEALAIGEAHAPSDRPIGRRKAEGAEFLLMFSKLRSSRSRRVILDLLRQLTKAEEACRQLGASFRGGVLRVRRHKGPRATLHPASEPQHPASQHT